MNQTHETVTVTSGETVRFTVDPDGSIYAGVRESRIVHGKWTDVEVRGDGWYATREEACAAIGVTL